MYWTGSKYESFELLSQASVYVYLHLLDYTMTCIIIETEKHFTRLKLNRTKVQQFIEFFKC